MESTITGLQTAIAEKEKQLRLVLDTGAPVLKGMAGDHAREKRKKQQETTVSWLPKMITVPGGARADATSGNMHSTRVEDQPTLAAEPVTAGDVAASVGQQLILETSNVSSVITNALTIWSRKAHIQMLQ